MKVVLFCGGFGMRLREYSESIPKPMVNVGLRPILWHIMKYYAHYGHKDFILCLGWQATVIKNYFLDYNECVSNDFVLRGGSENVELLNSDIQDWNITFVDTGTWSSIGQRLRAVEPHLRGEESFLANYTDGLTDYPLPELIEHHLKQDAIASFLSVRPTQSFHSVLSDEHGRVRGIQPIANANVWMNGGNFVLSPEIFDFMQPGEELVNEPFQRLIQQGRLSTVQYEGFWGCMDTYKEKQNLDDRSIRGDTPWEVWKEFHAPVDRRAGASSNRVPVVPLVNFSPTLSQPVQ